MKNMQSRRNDFFFEAGMYVFICNKALFIGFADSTYTCSIYRLS